MLQTNNKNSFASFDIIKIVCAIVILLYHYFSEIGHLDGFLDDLLSSYAIAVALFMSVSGFLTFSRINQIDRYEEKRAYLFRHVLRILKIYLLWSIVYITYSIALWDFSSISVLFVLDKLRQWIFQSTFYTIWFMPSLAVGLIIVFYAITRLGYKTTFILAVLFYIFGSLISTYSFLTSGISFWENIVIFCTRFLQGARGGLFYAFPLLFVGACAAKCVDKLCDFRFFLLLFFVLIAIMILLIEALLLKRFVGHTGIDLALMIPIVCFLIILCACKITVESNWFLVFGRKLSVLVFMTQRIFLTIIPSLLSENLYSFFFNNQVIGCIWVVGTTILFSSAILLLSIKIKFLRNLY